MTCQVGPIVLTCQLTGCWHGMPTMHADAMLMSWWYHPPSRLATWVGSSSIRVRSAHPGEGDAWHASVRVSSHLAGAWRPCSKSNFCAVFTSVLVSSSSKQWYGQNIILTTFIFEQKSNTALNQMLWYQLLGIPTSDVLIIAYWRLNILTQYLTWFGKSPTSMGEAIWLYRERTRFTTIKEEESFTL